jgi:hypothetical protein
MRPSSSSIDRPGSLPAAPGGCIHCRAIRLRLLPSRDRAEACLAAPATRAFAVAFAVFLAVALVVGRKPFYYDSHVYWALSHTFVVDGHFSLLNFENNGLRGYGLPLILFCVRNLGETFGATNSQITSVFNAALFAFVGAVLAPAVARLTWPGQRWGLGRRLILSALLLVFWHGYLSYPLSDFPALTAALLGLLAVASIDSPQRMLGAGLAAGLAVNMRPAYLLLVPALLALIAWGWIDRHRSGKPVDRVQAALSGWLFILGLAVVWTPQAFSNHDRLDSYSPIPGSSELIDFQYTEGLRLQRFDTYVGNGGLTPRMLYRDPYTKDILSELGGDRVDGTAGYAQIALEHPYTVAGVFLRHVVNGLDQRYQSPYVDDLDGGGNRALRLAGFLLVFLALARLLWPQARRRLGGARWRYPAVLLVGSASSIASAVEARFLLPAFVLAAIIVLAPGGWPSPRPAAADGPRRFVVPVALLIGFGAYCLVVGTIVSGASGHLALTASR